MAKRVFAIGAHPDDIEFGMAGTLFLLAKSGCEIHYMNVANGSCGTSVHDSESIVKIRIEEAKNACRRLGAKFYDPLVSDLEVFYEKKTLSKLSSIMRDVTPDILLIPSLEDYMEDHTITSRLAVTAAFSRSMRNHIVDPPIGPVFNDVTIYHAQPHGNRDAMNRIVRPEIYVDIADVIDKKAAMLAEHQSQKEWLDRSQGFDFYINTMKQLSSEVGQWSGRYEFAEGWRRHNPTGFCAHDANPMFDLLKKDIFCEE